MASIKIFILQSRSLINPFYTCSKIIRSLSTTFKIRMPDHSSVTAQQSRHDVTSQATIKEISDLSNTVKLIKLHVKDERFTFKAGQWVDFFIPGLETIGGFSMCSSPDLLITTRMFHLAVKFSTHPPAHWVHTKCQVGDSVMVRAGGDFYYDAEMAKTTAPNILLLAGGVGINPLYSILLQFLSLSTASQDELSDDRRATLLYSSATVEELLFRDELKTINASNNNVKVQLHCSKEKAPTGDVIASRIDVNRVQENLRVLEISQTEVYICGPSSFISDMESYCLNTGIPNHKIHYEKWW